MCVCAKCASYAILYNVAYVVQPSDWCITENEKKFPQDRKRIREIEIELHL